MAKWDRCDVLFGELVVDELIGIAESMNEQGLLTRSQLSSRHS